MLVLLLVVPSLALRQLAAAIDWRLLVILPAALSLFTFISYWSDKRRAEAGEWRVPESTLHLVEFLGGWPGAFLAQPHFSPQDREGFIPIRFLVHRLGPRVFRRRLPFGLALHEAFLSASSNHKRPNQAPEPTTMAVTPVLPHEISK